MKKTVAAAVALLMMISCFAGCGGEKNGTADSAGSSVSAAEEQQISAGSDDGGNSVEKEEETVSGMSDEEENISPEPAEGITVKESDYGYSIRYDADRFEYRRVEGYDDYSLKTYEGEKPSVYLCVSAIGKEYFNEVKKSLLGEDTSSVTIGSESISAEKRVSAVISGIWEKSSEDRICVRWMMAAVF